jgi:Protein of unknown function (DUF1064)
MATRGWENVTDIRRLKYGNVRTTNARGQTFDSKREADAYAALIARHGEILDLRRQVCFPLLCPYEDRSIMVSHYVADFVYIEHGVRHVVDAKGCRTAMYKLKKKWLRLQDGIEIEEV